MVILTSAMLAPVNTRIACRTNLSKTTDSKVPHPSAEIKLTPAQMRKEIRNIIITIGITFAIIGIPHLIPYFV